MKYLQIIFVGFINKISTFYLSVAILFGCAAIGSAILGNDGALAIFTVCGIAIILIAKDLQK